MCTPSSYSALVTNTIDLWYIYPETITEVTEQFLHTQITQEEKLSLQRYKNISAQQTALITRAICRIVLNRYTNVSPLRMQFTRNEHGKPSLSNNPSQISFNLSHNSKCIIMAVCFNDPIGCDIEDPNRKVSIDTISNRYFTDIEDQQLNALADQQKKSHFFKLWTLKEAFVKATGVGISLGLDSFFFEHNNLLKVNFRQHYPLDKQISWQFLQDSLNTQYFSVCRASKENQSINLCDAYKLLPIT